MAASLAFAFCLLPACRMLALGGGPVGGGAGLNFEVVIHCNFVDCVTSFGPVLCPVPLWVHGKILSHSVIQSHNAWTVSDFVISIRK